MPLSEKERDLLAAVHIRANLPLEKICAATGLRDHVVRYHLQKLFDRGIIGNPLPFINVYRLGYTEFVLYMSIAQAGAAERAALLELFEADPAVSWVMRFESGPYEYAVSICAKHPTEVSRLLGAAATLVGNIFSEKTVSVRLSFSYYGRRYLSERVTAVTPLRVGQTGEAVETDDVDRKILLSMARGEFKSVSELSRRTDIAQTTLERRKRRLEELGVIEGYLYRIEPRNIGSHFQKLFLAAKGINPELTTALQAFSDENPHVVSLVECLGSWDYELGVEAESREALAAVSDDVSTRFGKSLVSLSPAVYGGYTKRHNYPFYQN